jgi:L-lactate dehydrogenase complex protein LldG
VSPEIHVIYAGLSQLVPFIKDGFDKVGTNGNPSWIGLITGPSRTADIEKTLVLGAHGPKSLLVFIDSSF